MTTVRAYMYMCVCVCVWVRVQLTGRTTDTVSIIGINILIYTDFLNFVASRVGF